MDNENTNGKTATSIRLENEIYQVIAQLAAEDDRPSQANMIERLLKTHPRVQAVLGNGEAEAVAA